MKNRQQSSTNIAIDLHLHSEYSDGSRSPRKIVGLLKKAGVKLAALTDHDTALGTDEFMSFAAKAGITVFPGIEISASHKGVDVHVLGYNINHKLSCLENLLRPNIEARRKRLNDSLEILAKNEIIKITEQEIIDKYNYHGPVISMMHVIDFISKINGQDFFETKKLFKRGSLAWTPFDHSVLLSAVDAVRIITKELGGVAVLAHPGKILKAASYKDDYRNLNSWNFLCMLLKDLRDEGLSGIESFHPSHNMHQQIDLAGLAMQMKLSSTAGSDFHGKFKKNKNLGMSGIVATDFLDMIKS